ncbi:nicotinate-nucleotide--dimethylbenzimidazole phosphoribosyltransferase [Pseudoalteromonas phenolica]|uniref:Nicotinate-nucleotide--dimethylbenzimidazole phosphoribosyltransferase n=2 Tax=Pseudoalteromonas TaxID=53246 RepID=A0A5S3YX80_9GAMM|nr:nicotinate-nucleotide--dimethylbenzimidazole phosphoribosyltransferase [Pseudoalteromonas phenolica]TMN92533.1 nicotinate-nucleotide--dimethylbenzimidazole phosphoribosyltransferase [Pseudoalteromonas phenolica]TMP82006.1 nicotinate-nucleotide--dimethylbenzimidazole phosphoribosyltransferase [Pseudoalteromonas phenolica]
MFSVKALDTRSRELIEKKINLKTKPLGALGELETLAKQLVTIFSQGIEPEQLSAFRPQISKPTLTVFAGDHGIAAKGVSIAPSEVTGQMVANFASGGAAINVFSKQLGWQLEIVDCGILGEPDQTLGVTSQRLGSVTRSFDECEALTQAQEAQGFEFAKKLVHKQYQQGCNTFAFGEMGIGNTSAASAIFSALSGLSAEYTVGLGTGVSNEVVDKKVELINSALDLHRDKLNDPHAILRCLGGFEICQMVGAMLAVAELQQVIVVDGFIATAAALLAIRIEPNSQSYMVFAHCSSEQAHLQMLNSINAKPLLDLGLRLGEGTGAALSLPLLQSALAFYNDMNSFDDANVTKVV